MNTFKVVPLCDKQLLDITKTDILNNGLYRKCDVYKSGGGYDRFPAICAKRLGINASLQFVVQLYGCPFRCPYCYVTEQGIFGKYVSVQAEKLIADFNASGCEIFHLMGGAPALYMDKWQHIIGSVPIFHSDLLLVESEYKSEILDTIAKPNALYAVSVKGCTAEEYKLNTGARVGMELIKRNLLMLQESNVNFYITFTGLSIDSINKFKQFINDDSVFEDSFNIELIKYNALDK